jgi:excisionase family DNA binding protein
MHKNAKERHPLMRVKEAARLLDQHPATVYRKVHDGTIPAFRVGPGRAAIRIPRDELLAQLAGNAVGEENPK